MLPGCYVWRQEQTSNCYVLCILQVQKREDNLCSWHKCIRTGYRDLKEFGQDFTSDHLRLYKICLHKDEIKYLLEVPGNHSFDLKRIVSLTQATTAQSQLNLLRESFVYSPTPCLKGIEMGRRNQPTTQYLIPHKARRRKKRFISPPCSCLENSNHSHRTRRAKS